MQTQETTTNKREAQAITIAHELHPDFLLIDELKGRSIAKEMGIKTIGLAGILVKAKRDNIIPDVKSYELHTPTHFYTFVYNTIWYNANAC